MLGNWLFNIIFFLSYPFSFFKAFCKQKTALMHIQTESIGSDLISAEQKYFPTNSWYTKRFRRPNHSRILFLAYRSLRSVSRGYSLGNSCWQHSPQVCILLHLQNKLLEESHWKCCKWQTGLSPKLKENMINHTPLLLSYTQQK